jgi:hypothetical protein
MKIMFNGLDRPFELSNSIYIHELRKYLYFAKHRSPNLSLYIYIRYIKDQLFFLTGIVKFINIPIIILRVNCLNT